MKTLAESLFDIDKNTTKDITIGDVFDFDNDKSLGMNNLIYLELSAQRVKRASGVSGSSPNEIIYNGVLKLIQNIKIDVPPEEADRDWLEEKVSNLTKDLFRAQAKNKNTYIGLHRQNRLVLTHDESIFNVDTIKIQASDGLRFIFNKKK